MEPGLREAAKASSSVSHQQDRGRLDGIGLEVFRYALTAVAEEMAVTLQRAAYSTNLKTRLDFSCALFDRELKMLAQSFGQPSHLGSLVHFVPQIAKAYGLDELRPGDVVICNDGHMGGVHLNDVCLVAPVFYGEDIVGLVATIAHHVDVGGATPGSIGLSREIYEEGLIIPAVLAVQGGRFDERILKMIAANVHSAQETTGDLRAQVAGLNIGVRRTIELIERSGLAAFQSACESILDYTERRVRDAIGEIPQGVYRSEGFLDDDGFSAEPIRVSLSITVGTDSVLFDLAGSDQQRPGPINATYGMTLAGCAYALRALIQSDLPTNDGFYRVLEVRAPAGTVVNAKAPAAIGAGWETALRVCETAFQAFAEVIPERICAGSKGTICNVMFGGFNPRSSRYFAYYEAQAGGYGGRGEKDGIDAIQPHGQNTENSPVEELEANYPVRIVRYAIIPDSEGAGRFRGGVGVRRDYTFESGVTFSVIADRRTHRPQGVAGGGEALGSRFERNPGTPAAVSLPSKFSVQLEPGDVFSVQTGGGGGFGDPLDREPDSVLADVLAGKVSVERAVNAYGVVVLLASTDVDQAATRDRRESMRNKRAMTSQREEARR